MATPAYLVFVLLAAGAHGHRVDELRADGGSRQSVAGSVFLGQYKLLARISVLDMPEEFRGFSRVGDQPLGAGSFGETWLARELSTDEEVVLKFFLSTKAGEKIYLNPNNAPSLGPAAVDSLQDARAECDIPDDIIKKTQASPNYVPRCRFNGVDDPERSFLVLEKAGSTTLRDYIKSFKERNPTEDERSRVYASIARMLLEGLSQFEDLYVHRDIKLENIMVTVGEEGDPTDLKIIDWGLAVPKDFEGPVAGNRAHLPPETIRSDTTQWGLTAEPFVFTPQYDVYAAGETLYSFMCTEDLKTMRRLTWDNAMRRHEKGLGLKPPFKRMNRELKFVSAWPSGTPGCRDLPKALHPLLRVVEAATQRHGSGLVRPLASELLRDFASVLAPPGGQEQGGGGDPPSGL